MLFLNDVCIKRKKAMHVFKILINLFRSQQKNTKSKSNKPFNILFVASQLHQMVFFFRFKSSRSKNLEGVDVSTSNKELSLSDYRDQDREEREYHYVSYDEISKRGSYENKSPSQSYIYDVTWL